jgi:hypothetical protein
VDRAGLGVSAPKFADLTYGWCVTQSAAELTHHKVASGVRVVTGWNVGGERVEVVAEAGACELGGEVVAKLGEAERGVAHVVVEAGDDLLRVGLQDGETEPEVEEVAALAALVKRT